MTSENDTRVSEAYREASGEKAPEHLNRAILDEAKRASRPRYARSRAWTRPLAWAATIVLSVAIVLELTQVEELDGLTDEVLEESLPSSPQSAEFRAKPVKSEAESAGRMQKSLDAPARISAEDFEPQDKDLLQDAEEAAELRHSEPKAFAPAMMRSVAAPLCPDDARRDPESWMACIERLEEAGLHEEAELQRGQLAEAFPDFELP